MTFWQHFLCVVVEIECTVLNLKKVKKGPLYYFSDARFELSGQFWYTQFWYRITRKGKGSHLRLLHFLYLNLSLITNFEVSIRAQGPFFSYRLLIAIFCCFGHFNRDKPSFLPLRIQFKKKTIIGIFRLFYPIKVVKIVYFLLKIHSTRSIINSHSSKFSFWISSIFDYHS